MKPSDPGSELGKLIALLTGRKAKGPTQARWPERILLATDGTMAAEGAAHWSAWFGRGRPVSVATVETYDQPDADEGLARAVNFVRQAGGSAAPHRLRGSPTQEILAEAAREHAGLLIMASHEQSKLEFHGAPGIARNVLAASHVNMLLARRHPPPTLVVACVDGSPESLAAAAMGLEIARHASARLHIVHAIPARVQGRPPDPCSIEGVPILSSLLEGDPGPAVVAYARRVGAGLVVLGSRGLGIAPSWALGRASEYVAEKADSAVFLVRDPVGTTQA